MDIILSQPELERWGRSLGRTVRAPHWILLRGALGAGKSALARAIAAGAGVTASMPSPTFNLLFRYPVDAGHEIVHVDLYRLRSPDELDELGWDELGGPGEVVIVEWPERAGDRLPGDGWDVRLSIPEAPREGRKVDARAFGDAPPIPAPREVGSGLGTSAKHR